MDWNALITDIFQVCLIPLLGVLTTFFVKWINAKSKDLAASANDQLTEKYVNMLADTITACVIATNQTYVDSLKAQGKFDADAQKIALRKTGDAVMAILNDEAKAYLTNAFGDLETYISNKIEAEVKLNKAEK